MSQTKRAWKLQEFVAHGSTVNCVALSKKSGRVIVTGGEDRKVNLWIVGKPNCLMSLCGHTTPVESVRFGHEEEMVVAGSMSGALKVWDLEQAKIMRTLTGHTSSIKSLDFHPYGDYCTSGSLDCNVKLWDIRKKGCIYTYRGHKNGVNCVRFSPDGKWIASAGEDGLVKIWDITAGKILTDLTYHNGPVNIVEYHPNELLLASGSSDRTVKFWDLENFNMVSTTDGDSTPVRNILFHPEGTCLFSGTKDLLKVYSWEPSKCYDSIPVNWGEVADIAIGQNQLIGTSFSQTNVSTFVVDLKRVQPFGGIPHQEGGSNFSSSRNKFITERPPTQSSRQASVPKEDIEEPTQDKEDQDNDSFEIANPEDYRQIFRPKSRLSHSPTRQIEPFQPPPEDGMFPTKHVSSPRNVNRQISSDRKGSTERKSATPFRKSQSSKSVSDDGDMEPVRQPAPTRSNKTSKPVNKPPSKPVVKPSPRQPEEDKSGISPEDFLPQKAGGNDGYSSYGRVPSENETLSTLFSGHDAMARVLAHRSKNLQIVRAMWTSGNTKTAVDSAISMKDPSVIVDLLNVLNLKSGLWSLDLCSCLLPQVQDLMDSKYDSYVTAACEALKIMLRNFGPVIKSNLTAPPSQGVDLSREERYRKCRQCYENLCNIRSKVASRGGTPGKLGQLLREIQILMASMD
ncbi:katanin p80 WD40 repeat-containing subunit B1-like isoform X2 [Crassostrea angulata]|uniref:katanin p80 WD40 repeat-containing subunit B1-like isoform X2 n=1 Tax=Magallana angulata TaxID=2784310 RepID=UPI0022B2093E|nr:katanin p80 WD40 repeat-containing subunit B1-like isoform X2 [Crassostrea angulata]